MVVGGDALWRQVEISATDPATGNPVALASGHRYVPPAAETLRHDADGNLIEDARWLYFWDAENRLTGMEEKAIPIVPDPANGSLAPPARRRLAFAYDAEGRRIAKTVHEWNDASSSFSTLVKDQRFLYDGWNLTVELDHSSATSTGLAGSRVQRQYVWGLDLSGTLQGAGGVGGLLWLVDNGVSYLPCLDANGNVMALVRCDGRLGNQTVARFDYDAFGNRVTNTGPDAEICPFGFSTKYRDEESGDLYYGHRNYRPSWGRWLNRDPIEEEGGINLYGMVGNDAVNQTDYLGMVAVTAIPGIMRANGMTNGAALMDHWFAGSGATDKSTITMSWVLGYARAKKVWDEIIDQKIYVNAAAKKEIVTMLKRTGKYTSGGTFGKLSGDVETLDKDYIQQRGVGSFTDPIDDMFAALGKFNLRVLVKGEVCVSGSTRTIRIDKIGVYVSDSYDFTGWQPLGYWNSTTNYVGINPLYGDYVENADFRKHGGGKDFKVFSDIKIKTITPSESFTDP